MFFHSFFLMVTNSFLFTMMVPRLPRPSAKAVSRNTWIEMHLYGKDSQRSYRTVGCLYPRICSRKSSRPSPTIWNGLDTTRQTKHVSRAVRRPQGIRHSQTEKISVADFEHFYEILAISSSTPSSYQHHGSRDHHKMNHTGSVGTASVRSHTHVVPRLQSHRRPDPARGQSRKLAKQQRLPLLPPGPLPPQRQKWMNSVIEQNLRPEMLHPSPLQTRRLHLLPPEPSAGSKATPPEHDFIYVTTRTLEPALAQLTAKTLAQMTASSSSAWPFHSNATPSTT